MRPARRSTTAAGPDARRPSASRCCSGFADLIEAHLEELALLDSLEAGKPITDCREADLPEAINTFRWYAEAADKVLRHRRADRAGRPRAVVREPIGVVGAVLPWNFPIMLAAWKAAPALAAGNSVVDQAGRADVAEHDAAGRTGRPRPGCRTACSTSYPGLGETAGQALGRHPDVDVVTFTGSTEVGRLFLRYCCESNLKRIVLECGGKSPQVVMADAATSTLVAEQAC